MMAEWNGLLANCMTAISYPIRHSILKGKGSTSDAKVICVGTNDQQMNLTTTSRSFGRSTESDMITRAVMKDQVNSDH